KNARMLIVRADGVRRIDEGGRERFINRQRFSGGRQHTCQLVVRTDLPAGLPDRTFSRWCIKARLRKEQDEISRLHEIARGERNRVKHARRSLFRENACHAALRVESAPRKTLNGVANPGARLWVERSLSRADREATRYRAIGIAPDDVSPAE